ncbi:hypothetical protein CC1G_15602 [Coprinopsis cinerea okayama7|uniref:F-box domain-containing protein n=1 Tax=Coprinopsis cinerea (strain Okayama-7 / 130 / ATCC MYA-4618 / FGSC 9003) TaxID=240176 RepID=D6RND2_COPC7|nr:hypothetical protein CC1G_15602 [Coprinopsis cinerea okayama7\|eukprot:XP_002911060.1 hypothetical protein CC1G_15602 [Coprinopsis cinerea okayama7\
MSSDLATPAPRDDVLSNEDLLGIIFGFVQEFNHAEATPHDFNGSTSLREMLLPNLSSNQQLLNLALTHKSFLEPALKVLWRHIPSLLPLLGLLPEFGLIGKSSDYGFKKIPSHASDWQRFHVYAPYVKAITLGKVPQSISPFVYHVLALACPSHSVGFYVPALRAIRVDCSSPANFPGAFFVTTASQHFPSLRKVEVVNYLTGGADLHADSQVFLQQLFPVLVGRQPRVNQLAFRGEWNLSSFTELQDRLPSLPQLSHVALEVPGSMLLVRQACHRLGQLRNLRHLSIRLSPTSKRSKKKYTVKEGFSSLRELEVVGPAWEASRVISSIEGPRLEHVFIHLTSFELLDALCLHSRIGNLIQSSPRLVTFSLTGASSGASGQDIFASYSQSSSPVSSDSEPSTAQVSIVHLLAERCPNLTSLTLPASFNISLTSSPDSSSGSGSAHPTYASITCLSALAKGCPHLVDLRLGLRLHAVAEDDLVGFWKPQGSEPDAVRRPHPLKSLWINAHDTGQLTVPECISIAKFLHGLFPRLVQLEQYGGSGSFSSMSLECKTFYCVKASFQTMKEMEEQLSRAAM